MSGILNMLMGQMAAIGGQSDIVYESNRVGANSGAVNTDTLVTGSVAITAGALAIALVSAQSTTVTLSTLTDSGGNTWTKAAGPQTGTTSTSAELWYCQDHDGGSVTVTGVWTAASTITKSLQVFSFTGAALTGGPTAITNALITAGTTHTGAALATTGKNVIVSIQQGNATPGTPAGSNGFTLLNGTSARQIGLYRIVTADGSYAPESTTSNSYTVTDVTAVFAAASL